MGPRPCDTSAHERPWWLRCEEAREARRVAATQALSAYTTSEGVSSKLPTPPKLPTPTAPLSPRAHRLAMSAVSMQRLKLSPCKEHHRDFWLPGRPRALKDPLHPSVMQGHRDFRTKDFVWSRPPTDYRASNWYIENHWALHSLRKSDSEPAKANQPWTSSAQFQACCVGGVGGGRKGRNKGSYEDDFVHQGKYVPPEFGLSQSDVTKEAEEIIKQKALERK
ncbi:hypothetical protein AK812_SmicGene34475 [Symbiodinium microadriaticum]|uniref:Uncharacterized protein n=1 Tax=Symbiodinium microadriaticum TaxID=2951 RepID=A0A1Q9CNX5_SYMMI|nr:hypothetical protein AK812_SmicGene34475 [Symbiodinium microadriaticum]